MFLFELNFFLFSCHISANAPKHKKLNQQLKNKRSCKISFLHNFLPSRCKFRKKNMSKYIFYFLAALSDTEDITYTKYFGTSAVYSKIKLKRFFLFRFPGFKNRQYLCDVGSMHNLRTVRTKREDKSSKTTDLLVRDYPNKT